MFSFGLFVNHKTAYERRSSDWSSDVCSSDLSRSGTRAKQAAAAVAGSAVITKVIPMPADLDDDDMESQVELEAVNYSPYPIEEVNLDFEVLGMMPDRKSTRLNSSH